MDSNFEFLEQEFPVLAQFGKKQSPTFIRILIPA